MQNDLISRSALLEDVLVIFDENHNDCHVVFEDDIENAPAVDAVEVVRCKDCIAFIGETKSVFQHCAYSGMNVGKEDFCSCGERRADDG